MYSRRLRRRPVDKRGGGDDNCSMELIMDNNNNNNNNNYNNNDNDNDNNIGYCFFVACAILESLAGAVGLGVYGAAR